MILNVKTHALEAFQHRLSASISRWELADRGVRAEVLFDELAESLVAEVSWHMTGRRAYGEAIVYPATWWDAVKDRWFPRWLRRRFPPRFTEITPEMTEYFPDITPIQGQRSFVYREFSAPKVRLLP